LFYSFSFFLHVLFISMKIVPCIKRSVLEHERLQMCSCTWENCHSGINKDINHLKKTNKKESLGTSLILSNIPRALLCPHAGWEGDPCPLTHWNASMVGILHPTLTFTEFPIYARLFSRCFAYEISHQFSQLSELTK
jgi:hypothetical protein